MAGCRDHDNSPKRIGDLERELAQCREENSFLREHRKRLALIVQSSSIPTLVVDENHVITHCNKAYEKLKGISAKAMIGTRNQWMTFYSEPRPVMMDFIVDKVPDDEILKHFGSRCRRSPVAEGAFEAELFFPDLGEQGEWLFFTAAPLVDDTDRLVGAVETIQNVTTRKRAEEALRNSERRFRTLLDFVPYPIAVFTMDGIPTYLNPSFTKVFGWTLEEMEGKKIPFVPAEAKKETVENLRRLYQDKILVRHESRRLTKDGKVLDVSIRAAVYSESDEAPSGVIAIFRDISEQKRIARINEAMLQISLALPRYPILEDLLDYVNDQVKRLLNTEGALVSLLDEERQEFVVLGAAYDATATKKRVKEMRFPVDQLVSGMAVKTGKPIIISDSSVYRQIHEERDRRLGYKTRNLAVVPWRARDRIGGTVCANNKKQGNFEEKDIELLEMIAGTVALSIENARVSEELKKAYEEVSSLNRAKDKAINHLSHELKTPVAVLSGTLSVLSRRLESLPEESWRPLVAMAERHVTRISEIQDEAQDIMAEREGMVYPLLSMLFEECADEIALLFSQAAGSGEIIEEVRRKIDELFGPKKALPEVIELGSRVRERLDHLAPSFADRKIEITTFLEPGVSVFLPPEVLSKVIDGLIRNAVENTPDEGRIEVEVRQKGDGSLLLVRDYGTGITEEARKRIFEGFFHTQDTMAYSTKKPFAFGAGGKGADLLRMKIFSDRYGFQIDMASERCRFIPKETDSCPGQISRCRFCDNEDDCPASGTVFSVYFPARK